ncbi:MAG: hypothetical protein SGI90_16630 [Candidatus Eisenbacteria bacterium]|nr:hypothetical protein [Candidatus Eisenbacteria bacterium]
MRLRLLVVISAVLVASVSAAAFVAAQSTGANTSPWTPLHYFLGSWTGEGHGEPGVSTVEREYAPALNDRFIEVKNRSTYLPQEKNSKGEVHEDRGFISWDRARKRFVFRQFHIEGFVNQYLADSVSASPDSIEFTSEAIENIPAGFRARETYRILGPDEFVERFEMAEPNGPFALYSKSRFKRKK